MKNEKHILRKISKDLLFYVDRNKTKEFWWSYDLKYAMEFASKEAAIEKAKTLKFGHFEVMTLETAEQLRSEKTRKYNEAKSRREAFDADPGWDAHKFCR